MGAVEEEVEAVTAAVVATETVAADGGTKPALANEAALRQQHSVSGGTGGSPPMIPVRCRYRRCRIVEPHHRQRGCERSAY
jgi:hypothetical protein